MAFNHVETDERYPSYGVIEVEGAGLYIPVILEHDHLRNRFYVRDCFGRGGTSVTAFADEDKGWDFVESDYKSIHPEMITSLH